MEESATLRARYQADLVAATKDFFDSNGLPELNELRWHQQERDLGFEVPSVGSTSLRALNFAPRARRLLEKLGSVPGKSLGAICAGGTLRTGTRFKRIDSDPDHGIRLIGQRQSFWIRPEGRWINEAQAPSDIRVQDETILIAARGTLGENEVYSRSIFVTGSWLKHASARTSFASSVVTQKYPAPTYSHSSGRMRHSGHFVPSASEESSRSTTRASCTGCTSRSQPPPTATASPPPSAHAYQCRDRADVLEDKALALLTAAVEEAAG